MVNTRALEAHLALFGLFDTAEQRAAIEAAIEKRDIPDMSKARKKKKERDELPDSAFGLPKKRKYPLIDKNRVLNAIKYFKFCPKEDQKELATNLKKAVKKFHIKVVVTKGNPIIEYFPDAEVVAPKKRAKK